MSTRSLRRIERLEKLLQKRDRAQPLKASDLQIQAIRDPYLWATQYTETYNPHWVEEGRKGPYEKFPSFEEYPHLCDLFQILEAERIHFIEKSRDMMVTWACVALPDQQGHGAAGARSAVSDAEGKEGQTAHQVRALPPRRRRVRHSRRCRPDPQLSPYDRQPQWLKDAFPLARHQSDMHLGFAHARGGTLPIDGMAIDYQRTKREHTWQRPKLDSNV